MAVGAGVRDAAEVADTTLAIGGFTHPDGRGGRTAFADSFTRFSESAAAVCGYQAGRAGPYPW